MASGSRSSAPGSGASSRSRPCGMRGSSRARSRSSATAPTRPRLEAARRRDPAAGDALESDGHCAPTSFPGWQRARRCGGATAPLVLSVCDRYRPTVEEFLRHVERLRAQPLGQSFVPGRIDRSPPSTAASRSAATASSGTCSSPPVTRPRVARGALRRPARRPRLRAARVRLRVTVVGAGMAAATEWLNALAAGAEVVSVGAASRCGGRSTSRGRCSRSAASLASTRSRGRAAPSSCAASASRRTRLAAPGTRRSRRAAREGRFRVEQAVNGAEQVICATGFRRGFRHDPLLARLVDEHGLETEDRWIVLADDASVPALSDRAGRSRSPACRGNGLPGRRHARRDEGRSAPLQHAGWCRVLHAERPDRDAARGRAPAGARRGGGGAAAAQVVAARARRADARDRAHARRARLPPALPYQPGWVPCRSGCSSSH